MPIFPRLLPTTPGSTPPWLKLAAIAFIGISLVSYLMNPEKWGANPQTTLFNFDAYRGQVFPTFGGTQITEVKEGSGPIALCGQKATIHVKELNTEQTAEEQKNLPIVKRSIMLGGTDGPRALQQSVLDMRVGGERSVFVPAAYTEKRDKPIRYTVLLDAVEPSLASSGMPLRSFDIRMGSGPAVSCGDTVSVHLTLWNGQGKNIFDTRRSGGPLSLTLDGSNPLIGLVQGMLGMASGGLRTVVIPYALARPLLAENASPSSGDSPKDLAVQTADVLHNLALPEGQLVLADVEILQSSQPTAP